MTPIRIGGVVAKGSTFCVDCGPGHAEKAPHVQPAMMFTLLAWVPCITKAHAEAHGVAFWGDSRTPPTPIMAVTANAEGAEHFVRYLHCN